ncbi:MAG: ATP-binding cassette domain-containing protein [Thermoplasmatales archaeon]
MLRLTNVTKNFGKLAALKNVNLEFGEGEMNAIIGPNGAGKTTLINVITGVLREDTGIISFYNKNINRLPAYARTRLGINRTFQIPKPFLNLTVAENVRIGTLFSGISDKSQVDDEVENILDLLGLKTFSEKTAAQLNTEQRKLVDLGRALASKPKYLFIDEIGAGLAEGEIAALSSLIRGIQKKEGISIIYVGHVMKLVQQLECPITVFSEGSPIFHGSYDEVVTNDEIIKLYLGARYVKGQ